MDQLITEVRSLLGAPPAGFETVEYMVAACLLVLLCMSAVGLVSSIFKWVGDL